MASNEIRYRLRLDDDEFKSKIDDAANHGKNAFKDIHETLGKAGGADAGERFGSSFEKIFDKVKDKFHEKLQEVGEGGHGAAHKIRETIHTVHPIVEEAELGGLGRIGAFALAARAGIASLATALTGTLLVALEKLADETNSRVARLSQITGSTHTGKEAEESLGRASDRVGLPASKLASAHEALLGANDNQLKADRLGDKGLEDVLASAFNLAAAGGQDRDKAVEPLAQFFKDLGEKGGLSAEQGKASTTALPGLAPILEELRKKNPNAPGGFYPLKEVLDTVQNLGPQAEKAAAATGHTSIPDASSGFARAGERFMEALPEIHPMSAALDAATKFTDEMTAGLKGWAAAVNRLKGSFVAKALTDPGALQADERGVEPGDLRPSGEPFLAEHKPFGDALLPSITGREPVPPEVAKPEADHGAAEHLADSHNKAADAAGHAADATGHLAGEAEGAARSLKDIQASQAEDRANLDRIGAKNSTAQAKLDYQYKPEENAIKLDRDQLAVENAQLSVQQSLLSATQSQKAVAQSKLAPETAQENVNSAESNWRKALHRFHELRGVRDNYNPQQEAMSDSADALDAAQTAVKRAKIEKRYAYLEEPKAKLAAEKAKTDIRSAEFLERDSKLALTKDKKGNVLSEEVSGLRYADASLKEAQVIAANTKSAEETLQKILEKIGAQNDKNKKSEDKSDQEKRDQTRGEQPRDGRRAGSGARPGGDTASDTADNAAADAAREARDEKELYRRSRQIKVKPGDLKEPSLDDAQPYGSADKARQLNERDKIARSGLVDDEFGRLSTNKAGQALNDTAVEGFGKRPRDVYEMNKSTADQGDGGRRRPFSADDTSYPAPTLGKYNDQQQFVPNSEQPYPRARRKPYAGSQPYNPAEDAIGGDYVPGAPPSLGFPQYDKYLRDEVAAPVPLPQPRPEAAPGPQSELLGPIQQLASAMTELSGTIAQSNGQKQQDTNPTGNDEAAKTASQDVAQLGSSADSTDQQIASLGDAAANAADNLNSVSSGGPSGGVTAAGGGHIRGPGTSTSDDINAKLSDGEFVVNARDTSRNLPLLHDINDGKYARGGLVGRLAAMGFAKGGLIDVPHFAVGGPVRGTAPRVDDDGGGGNGGAPAGHYSVDLRTNHGDFKMMAPEHVARQMSRAAVASTSVQAGPRPGWYGK